MGQSDNIKPWRPTDRASASKLNAMLADIRAMSRSPMRRGIVDATGRYPADSGAVGVVETRFLAHITASALQPGHAARWDYTFAEVELTPTGYQAVSGGRTGTTINIIELAHIAEPGSGTPWYVWGVNAHGANYPAGFRPRPVGGGGTSGTHKVNQPVEITERTDSEGNTVYTFQGWGSHDGGCSA